MISTRRSRVVLIALCASFAVASCSSSGAPAPSTTSSPPGAAPSGDAGSASADRAAAAAECVHNGRPVLDPTSLPACPMCSGGHCVPSALVPAESAADLADCDATSKCVPDQFIETGGDFLLPTCTSIGGAEGRCMSLCIPQVAEQPDLPQSTCAADERCAPCFDTNTGASTGACTQGCDPGPASTP